MAIIKLRNLGSEGVNSDAAPETLSPLAFTRVENVSFYNRTPYKARGYASNMFGVFSFVPYAIMPAQGPTDFTWVIAGLDEVSAYFNGNLIDITRVDGFDAPVPYTGTEFIPWTGAWLNGVTFLNNGTDVPQFVSTIGASSKLADLTDWDSTWRCRCLRGFKNYLFALDVTKSGTRYPTLFKWSHPADPGGIPPSWDETAAAFDAGEFPISMTPGRLIDGLAMKNSFIIYKSDGIVAVRETFDNSIFRFDPISLKFGIPAPNCVTEFQPGLHAFISQTGDLMVNNGQTVNSIATNRVKKRIREIVDSAQLDRSYVVTDVRNSEIMFCFVTGGADWANYAITWNWEENTFGEKYFPPCSAMAEGKYNLVLTEDGVWDDDSQAWDDDETTWDGTTANVISNRILGVSPTNQESYLLAEGYSADGAVMRSLLERRTIPLAGQDLQGNLTLDPKAVKLITRVYPILETVSPLPFKVRVGVQDQASGSITWQGPFDFNPAEDTFVEFFCEGRYISYQISHEGTDPWRLVGFDIDLSLNGEFL